MFLCIDVFLMQFYIYVYIIKDLTLFYIDQKGQNIARVNQTMMMSMILDAIWHVVNYQCRIIHQIMILILAISYLPLLYLTVIDARGT